MDFSISTDEQLLVETARRFGDEWLRNQEREHEKARGYGDDVARTYRELGLTHLGATEDLGGLELPLPIRARIWETVAGADPGATLALGPWEVAATALATFDEGREVLRDGRPGAVVVVDSLELSEGAVSASIPWVPAASAEWLLLIGPDEVLWVDAPPVAPLADRTCGLQASGGLEVHLDATPCKPVGDRVMVDSCLAEAWALTAAAMLGAARDAHAYACRYAQDRVAFGKPIAHHQALAFLLVDCATELDGAGLLLDAACASGDLIEVANAYVLVGTTAGDIAERAVQVLGGHGYLYDHPVEKRMRDIRSLASLFGGIHRAAALAAEQVLDIEGLLELRGKA